MPASTPPEVVAVAEIAQLLGVGVNRAWQLSRQPDFPAPIAELSMGRVWRTADVVAWSQDRGRTVRPIGPPKV